MAIYTSPVTRRARILIVGLLCLVAGVIGGLVIGRASVTTTGERIAHVHTVGDDLATRVEALTIEYEQALSGQGDTIAGGVLDALDGIKQDASATADDAPWLTRAQRDDLDASLQALAAAANARVDNPTFADQTARTAALLRATFGSST